MDAERNRLNLIKMRKPSVVFNFLLTTMPMTKNEIEFALSKSSTGNSRLRAATESLIKAKYLEEVEFKRSSVKKAIIEKIKEPHQNEANQFTVSFEFSSIPKKLIRYTIGTRFLEDISKLIKYAPKSKCKDILNEIELRTKVVGQKNTIPFNYKLTKNINNLDYLQRLCLMWFIERDFISTIVKSRKRLQLIFESSAIAQEVKKLQQIGLNPGTADVQKCQNELEKTIDDNLYLFEEELVCKEANKDDIKLAFNLHMYLPSDVILDDLNHLLVYSNPTLNPLTKQTINRKWDLMKAKETSLGVN
jgi:hypothetical protein